MKIKRIYVILGLLLIFSCKEASKNKESTIERRGLENEDAIELEMVRSFQDKIRISIEADVETTPVSAQSLEDAADDPAIWYNSIDPGKSIVYGSNKRGGIIAYDLEGKELEFYPVGNVNNIDVLDRLSSAEDKLTLLGCSNRSTQSIDLFFILENGKLKAARNKQWQVNPSEIDDIYGFCFGIDVQSGTDYLFINGKNGRMEQFSLHFQGDTVEMQRVRIVQFDDQTEGMVADNESGTLYVGAENTGIWKLAIQPIAKEEKELIPSSTKQNEFIKFDIEGLSLMKYKEKTYLLASSQGNYSYAIFNVSDGDQYLTSFKIVNAPSIDGVEETDGIGISMDSLGSKFPKGVFVAQDGYNFEGDSLLPQNFKYVGLEKIHAILDNM